MMSVQKKRTRDIAAKHRVVLTGSECTGKTQIAQTLAAHFACPFSAEAARLYLDRQSMALTAQDIEPIACEQIAQEDAAVDRASELTIHDTDLLSTVIYARHYYQHCPDWIVDTAHSRARGLYLLCDIDLPWLSDGLLRDRGLGGQRAQGAGAFTFRRHVEPNWSALDVYTRHRPCTRAIRDCRRCKLSCQGQHHSQSRY